MLLTGGLTTLYVFVSAILAGVKRQDRRKVACWTEISGGQIPGMWCGDWSQLPQESLRFFGPNSQSAPAVEDGKSLLYTLGNPNDGNNHLVRVACLGPYLFGSSFFSKDCEIWARSSGIYYHPAKLVDNTVNAEVREAILVLDTLAYHVSFVLVVCKVRENGSPYAAVRMADKYKGFLDEFDKETIYANVRSLVEASDFFRLFRKKLTISSLREEQIIGCFMIALKASIAHCHGALDTMLTYIKRDCEKNGEGSRADELKKSGNQKYKEKSYDEACEFYTRAIAEMRYNHILYSNRALSALQLQKYREVELDARRVIILNPDFEKGYFKMAQVYESQKQSSRAKKVVEYYTKRCNFLALDISREVLELHKRLTEAGEKSKNGKTDTKNTHAAANKSKAKPAVPDLVSDSDSDEMTTPAVTQPKPTTQQKAVVNNRSMMDILKKSCEDLLGGLYKLALQGFKTVLAEKPKLSELDMILVEYAAGCASLEMGSLEDLKSSVEFFLGITNSHKDVVFPLAYYGVSRALIKMNRFSEALPHIEKCISILQKGIHFPEKLLWPETKTKVDNAERTQIQKAMEEMQTLCRAPPKWDAVCCHAACPLQKSIYYSDPDFRGFQQLRCASKCLIQYHPTCWREYRESRNLTEKGFLGEMCPTPDCRDTIIKVETIEKDGTIGKQFVHSQLLVETAPKQKKTKKEKKLEQREQKKQQRRAPDPSAKQPSAEREEDPIIAAGGAGEPANGTMAEEPSKESSVERLAKASKAQPKAAPGKLGETRNEPSEAAPAESTEAAQPLHGDAPYILKKDEDIDDDILVDGRARRWKRKRNRPVRVLELDAGEFLYSEYQERIRRLAEYKNAVEEHGDWKTFCQKQKEMIPQLDPDVPFYIPEELRCNEAALEAVLQHHGSVHGASNADVNETIYQLFEDVIESRGPMSIHDKCLADEVAAFPEAAQKVITQAGGLQSFLLRSLRFTFDGDIVHTARMRPRGHNFYRPDEVSLPDDSSEYQDEEDLECEDTDEEEEEYDEEEATGFQETFQYIETVGSIEKAAAPAESADANCSLNPNAKAFELRQLSMALPQESEQQPDFSYAEKELELAVATARTDTGREVVAQRLLAGLPPKQLSESLVVAVNAFNGPLVPNWLSKINAALQHCRLANKSAVRDISVQVGEATAGADEQAALRDRCEELECENLRFKEKLESALDSSAQLQRKHMLENKNNKEKMEELRADLQTEKQNLKKARVEMEAEIKKLQQERMRLKEEVQQLKTNRNENDVKDTLDRTITEFAKLKCTNDELEETCKALEEASDSALDRAKRAEIRILETAHKWGLERFEQAKQQVENILHEIADLIITADARIVPELAQKERSAKVYFKEYTSACQQFEKKVQEHIKKVQSGQALADLDVIDLPTKFDFEFERPRPQSFGFPGNQGPQPASRPYFGAFASAPAPAPGFRKPKALPFQQPLLSHAPGVLLPTPLPTGLPGAMEILAAQKPAPGGIAAGPPPGLGYFPGAHPMTVPEGDAASPHPSSPSRSDKSHHEGHAQRSERLMQKLLERHPTCSRENIKAALQQVHKSHGGLKGLTITEIIKATSCVLDETFQCPQEAGGRPRPRPVLKAMRTCQGHGPDPPAPGPGPQPPQQKTWASRQERPPWNGCSTQCSICLEDLDGRQKEMTTKCGHCFHEKCLQEWFRNDQSCPNCRAYSLSDTDFPKLG